MTILSPDTNAVHIKQILHRYVRQLGARRSDTSDVSPLGPQLSKQLAFEKQIAPALLVNTVDWHRTSSRVRSQINLSRAQLRKGLDISAPGTRQLVVVLRLLNSGWYKSAVLVASYSLMTDVITIIREDV